MVYGSTNLVSEFKQYLSNESTLYVSSTLIDLQFLTLYKANDKSRITVEGKTLHDVITDKL